MKREVKLTLILLTIMLGPLLLGYFLSWWFLALYIPIFLLVWLIGKSIHIA